MIKAVACIDLKYPLLLFVAFDFACRISNSNSEGVVLFVTKVWTIWEADGICKGTESIALLKDVLSLEQDSNQPVCII